MSDIFSEILAKYVYELKETQEVLYEAVEAKDVVPSEIPVTVTDESTGQTVEGTAMAAGQKIGEKRWEDTFSFPATFHEYGLDGYWLREKIFRLNGDTPDFKGYEKELLELIAVSGEDYQIESAVWNGEAYKDSDGVMCRNAIVSGKKLVCDCTVFYEDSEVFLEEKGVRYVATYKKEGTSQAGAHKYTMKATGVYVPKRRNGTVLAVVVGLTGVGAGAGAYGRHRKKKKMMGGGDGETENS